MYNLGWAAFRQAEWNLAKEWFEKAVAVSPGYADAMNYLGLIAENLNKPDEAIMIFKKGLETNPDYALLVYNLGRIYFDNGMLKEARACMEKTLQLPDALNLSDIMNYLGLIAKGESNKEEALNWFTKASEADIANHYPVYNLGVLHFDNAAYDQATACFKKVLEIQPQNMYAYNYLGLIAEMTNRLEDAILNYSKAVEIDESYAVAHYNSGIALYNLGRLDEAVVSFKHALRLKHLPGVCCNYLGAIAYTQGKTDEAIDYYSQALDYIPDYEFALFNLGECYFEKGNFTESLNYWEKVLPQRPNDWEVMWYKARCLLRLNKLDEFGELKKQLQQLPDVATDKMELLNREIEEFATGKAP